MATPTTKTEILKVHEHELTKSHQEVDGSGRLEFVYTAKDDARHGDPALVTRYTYIGGSSTVSFYKEYYGTWDASWDEF